MTVFLPWFAFVADVFVIYSFLPLFSGVGLDTINALCVGDCGWEI